MQVFMNHRETSNQGLPQGVIHATIHEIRTQAAQLYVSHLPTDKLSRSPSAHERRIS